MSFLHEEKPLPIDEFPRIKSPICEWCETEMWLTRVEKAISDDGARGTYNFECPNCRTRMKVRHQLSRPTAMPLAPTVPA